MDHPTKAEIVGKTQKKKENKKEEEKVRIPSVGHLAWHHSQVALVVVDCFDNYFGYWVGNFGFVGLMDN
jgi:hypothetical protein